MDIGSHNKLMNINTTKNCPSITHAERLHGVSNYSEHKYSVGDSARLVGMARFVGVRSVNRAALLQMDVCQLGSKEHDRSHSKSVADVGKKSVDETCGDITAPLAPLQLLG